MTILLPISAAPGLPLYLRVANALEMAIGDGRILAGEQFPPVRELSDNLRVSRATILKSIKHLRHKGVLDATAAGSKGVPGGHTSGAPTAPSGSRPHHLIDWTAQALRDCGLPTEAQGDLFLRGHLAVLLARRYGIAVAPEQVLLFSSPAIMFNVFCRILLDRHDVAATSVNCNAHLKQVLLSYCHTVIDFDNGIDDVLAAELLRLRAKLFVSCDSDPRLQDLLTIATVAANCNQGIVFLRELCLSDDQQPVPLWSMASKLMASTILFSNRVLRAGTAVHCCFAVVPQQLLEAVTLGKTQFDRHFSYAEQRSIYRLLLNFR